MKRMVTRKFLRVAGWSTIPVGFGLFLAACAAAGNPSAIPRSSTPNPQPNLVSGSDRKSGGDAVRGKTDFEIQCSGCHSLTQNRIGPKLGKVFGRSIASVPGFDYSPALKKLQGVWSETALDRWLADPQTTAKGNRMGFSVKSPSERKDLIAFLKSVS